jgi:integrase
VATIEKYSVRKINKLTREVTMDDRWRVRYRTILGRTTAKGSFKTRKAAATFERELEDAKAAGTAVLPSDLKLPLGPFIDAHLARTIGLTKSTIANRRAVAKVWVVEQWSEKKIGAIRRDAVNAWIELITAETAGPSTIQKAHGILLVSLQRAVDSGVLPSNPAAGATLPKVVEREHLYLTHEQVLELANAIDPRSKTLIGILSYCGLRFGELSALGVHRVDLAGRKLRITRAVTSVRGHMEEGPPKFGKKRTVHFPEIFDAMMAEQIKGKTQGDLVFTAARGGLVRLDDWRPRAFAAAKAKINLDRAAAATKSEDLVFEPFPEITPHDLRHTAASLAVSAGANIKALQVMLGHASASMTLDVYADLFSDDEESVAVALNNQASERVGVGAWKTGTE